MQSFVCPFFSLCFLAFSLLSHVAVVCVFYFCFYYCVLFYLLNISQFIKIFLRRAFVFLAFGYGEYNYMNIIVSMCSVILSKYLRVESLGCRLGIYFVSNSLEFSEEITAFYTSICNTREFQVFYFLLQLVLSFFNHLVNLTRQYDIYFIKEKPQVFI